MDCTLRSCSRVYTGDARVEWGEVSSHFFVVPSISITALSQRHRLALIIALSLCGATFRHGAVCPHTRVSCDVRVSLISLSMLSHVRGTPQQPARSTLRGATSLREIRPFAARTQTAERFCLDALRHVLDVASSACGFVGGLLLYNGRRPAPCHASSAASTISRRKQSSGRWGCS